MSKPKSLVPYIVISLILILFVFNVIEHLPKVKERYGHKAKVAEMDRLGISVKEMDKRFLPGVVYRVIGHELDEDGAILTLLIYEVDLKNPAPLIISSKMRELARLGGGERIMLLPLENKLIVLSRYQV